VGKGLNLLLSLACVGLAFALGRSMSGRREVGFIAAGILAIHPALVAYSSILAAEPLFLFLILLATWLAFQGADQPWLWLLVGVICGGAALVRPQAAVLPLLLVFGVWLWSRQRGKNLLPLVAAGLALVGLILALTPWTMRNRAVFGATFLVSLNGGDNLWIGHHPDGNGRYKTPPGIPQAPADELANERATRSQALAWIRENPGRSMARIPAKWEATFLSTTDLAYWAFQTRRGELVVPGRGADKPLYFFTQGAAWWANRLLLVLALVGVGLGLRHTGGRRFLAVPLLHIGLVALVTAVFFGNPRFGLPAIPFLALLAATPWVPADLDEKTRD
jgi:4-amino-4-deoxy-L-arabinose transferase-like glycosyltransferase